MLQIFRPAATSRNLSKINFEKNSEIFSSYLLLNKRNYEASKSVIKDLRYIYIYMIYLISFADFLQYVSFNSRNISSSVAFNHCGLRLLRCFGHIFKLQLGFYFILFYGVWNLLCVRVSYLCRYETTPQFMNTPTRSKRIISN